MIRVIGIITIYSVLVVIAASLVLVANGWTLPPLTATTTRATRTTSPRGISGEVLPKTWILAPTTTTLSSSASSIAEVSTMRLSEIKSELKERGVDFSDCFDKESMVAKLVEARANNIDNSKSSESAPTDEESTTTTTTEAPADFDREACLEELKGMRVRELREELGRRRISRTGLFEKEGLVNALLEARAIASVFSGSGLLTPGEVTDLSEGDVQAEIDHPGSLLLLDVYATWCGPCQMIAPILKDIAVEQGDQLRVVKMDSDQNQSFSSKLKVNGLPTLVLFRGGEEIDRLEGAPTKDQLMGWIQSRR